MLVISWLFASYIRLMLDIRIWTVREAITILLLQVRTPAPWGRAGGCFQLTSYCTRHLNDSIKIIMMIL